jgi:putative oxidoreductase
MKPLIETNARTLSIAILLLRVMAGLILFVAGAGKILGWFGGFGMTATLDIFKTNMHLSALWIYISCYAEFIGGFLIIIGLLTRVSAFILVINMLVAVFFTGLKNFFFGGAAYPCLLMIIFLTIVLTGPMEYSIDSIVTRRRKTEKANANFNAAF